MSKYIPINQFAEKYDINRTTIDVNKSIGSIPHSIFRSAKKGELFIDEEFFVRRKEFKNENTDAAFNSSADFVGINIPRICACFCCKQVWG